MQLELAVGSIPFDADATDTWHTIWGGDYTSKKFYTHAYQVIEADPIYKIIWKSSCTARILHLALASGQTEYENNAHKKAYSCA